MALLLVKRFVFLERSTLLAFRHKEYSTISNRERGWSKQGEWQKKTFDRSIVKIRIKDQNNGNDLCLFKVCNNATRTTVLCRSVVFIVNFEYISCIVILIIFTEVPPTPTPQPPLHYLPIGQVWSYQPKTKFRETIRIKVSFITQSGNIRILLGLRFFSFYNHFRAESSYLKHLKFLNAHHV